ncbi:uncharacterized protein ColSpa_05474 [Colletotrichum spaethianum]|uniref:Secreted protein n=1 Tax=Colletotrichum spaethianum TaxID=700344 RepID=A0AA37P1S6_9PEZI|nr:uncharacterized protein ColSpa_05474 [Colletotrichum spaethianum]GKT45293.1 hypothetical protein ColSpa_05474 [Colletotrichum spaethianum]
MYVALSSTFFAAIVLQLANPVSANYETGKAVQINFYSNSGCSAYTSETAAWWTRSPRAGEYVNGGAAAECFALNMPGSSQSINVASVWKGSGAKTSGGCYLYDGYNCGGVTKYADYRSGSGDCLAARSSAGYLWKSARCGAAPN